MVRGVAMHNLSAGQPDHDVQHGSGRRCAGGVVLHSSPLLAGACQFTRTWCDFEEDSPARHFVPQKNFKGRDAGLVAHRQNGIVSWLRAVSGYLSGSNGERRALGEVWQPAVRFRSVCGLSSRKTLWEESSGSDFRSHPEA